MQCKICQAEFQPTSEKDVCPNCEATLKTVTADSSGLLDKSLARFGKTTAPQTTSPVSLPATDLEGRGRQVWKSVGSDSYHTVGPMSVAMHPSGEILILDQPDEYRILRFDAKGKCTGPLLAIPASAEPGGVEDPQGLAIGGDGKLYIPDAGNDRISVWKANGAFSHWVGELGSRAGQLAHPMDVDVDADGFLYIADTFNRRVQKVSTDGLVSLIVQSLGKWGELAEPVGVAVDSDGRIYIVDTERNCVVLLSADGEPQRILPTGGAEGALFDSPGDVRVFPDGSMLVSDKSNLRIQRFDPSWNPVGVIDLSSENGDVSQGGDIAAMNEYVLIPDRFNDCVYCMAFDRATTEIKQ